MAALALALLFVLFGCASPMPPAPSRPAPPGASDELTPADLKLLLAKAANPSNIGPVAYDAKWSNYGAYLQRMIESIQLEWDRIMMESGTYPTSGTQVIVKFKIDKQGKIAEIVDVQGTAGSQQMKICTSAITRRAPYGDWTNDMIAVLGESQEMTFAFYYQ